MTVRNFVGNFAAAVSLGIAVLPAVPEVALAQEGVLEEVVVTSRKRAESLQETPISVMAFSPEALEKQNVSSLADLNAKLPNVYVGAGGGIGSNNAAFFIRGLGSSRNAINQESAVALYIDDAYYGRSDGALLSVLDVESIEVLRGPQGTLFGRNATAGAIRYITAKPGTDFEGKIQGTVGSFSRADLKASVNLPLDDATALRLTAATLNQGGFQTTAIGQEMGDVATDLFRAYLRWDASDTLEVLASLDYSVTDANGSALSLVGVVSNPGAAGGIGNGVAQQAALGRDATLDPLADPENNGSTTRNFNDTDSLGASLTLNWDLGGDWALKWASTYRELDIEGVFDFDAANPVLFENSAIDRDAEMLSTELQLSGFANDGRISWITGLFYYDESANDVRVSGSDWSPIGDPSVVTITSTRINTPHELESFAIFGQATFDISDRFSITAGARWTDDEKHIVAAELNAAGNPVMYRSDDPNGNTGPLIVNRTDSWNAPSGRLSFEFQATDDVFLFASYARGFRAGGINDRPRNDLPNDFYGITSFDEEILDVFEFGLRSDLLDNRLRLNLTYFYQDMQDLQFARTLEGSNRTVVQNAAEAKASGVEGEFVWIVSDAFQIDGNFGYLDTEVKEVDPGVSLNVGDMLGHSPELQYSIGLNYVAKVGGGELGVRVDYAWTDKFYTNPELGLQWLLDDYGLVNANIRYSPPSGKWALTVYGNNLKDEDYFVQALNFTTLAPFGIATGVPGHPLEVGVKADFYFGGL